MLHKGYGGYDFVGADFTSVVYAALASDVDIIAGDGNLAAQRNCTGQNDTDFLTRLCTEVVEAVLTAVNKLREIEHRISYSIVSNIRAEEWFRSSKGDPAHDGDCLALHMFRFPNKHPSLLAYRDSEEGRAETVEVIGQKTVLKETERFKYFINAD